MTTSDAEILRRTAAGSPADFDRIVDRHEAAVLRYLGAITDDPAAAEDALQETFLAAWRAAASFRGAGSARAWLLGIARNAVRRQHRRRSGEPAQHESLDRLGSRAGWGRVAAEPFSELLEKRDLIHKGFIRLEPDDREILVLRELEGFSGKEVATMLSLSLPAVKSRLHRARLRFMAALRQGVQDGA